jgi:hypothetical protein
LKNPEVEAKAGVIDFWSMTIRAFKLKLEDRCEDYGQIAIYLGTIPESPHFFRLDNHHLFEKGRPVPVCSNTAAMIQGTRYGPHFKVIGDLSIHYGLFECGSTSPLSPSPSTRSRSLRACLQRRGGGEAGSCC